MAFTSTQLTSINDVLNHLNHSLVSESVEPTTDKTKQRIARQQKYQVKKQCQNLTLIAQSNAENDFFDKTKQNKQLL